MKLADLRGNRAARDGILHAIRSGRLPHALLLYGPEGVGKAIAARAIAQALLCPQRDPDACDACNVCRRVVGGNHPDLIEVAPDGQFIKVDAVRAVVRDSHRRPFEGRAKVFLFPQADRFNDEAANALLKTLEEPPEHTQLILVTSSREAVLPTLRSRCQAVAFLPLRRDEVAAALCDEGIAPAEAAVRARRAEGSILRARSLDLDELERLEKQAVDLLLPLANGQLSPSGADRVIELAEDLSRKDGPFRLFLFDVLRPLVRDALVGLSGTFDSPAASLNQTVETTSDLSPVELRVGGTPSGIRELALALGSTGAIALLTDLIQVEEDLVINANKKLLIEALLLGVYTRAVEQQRHSTTR